jgi:sec-independent protein translocase protein TatA
MPNLGGWEFVILIGVLVLLFGAKKLPDMARSIGQSARVFKGEMKGLKDDGKGQAPAEPAASTAPPVAPPAPLPPATPATPVVVAQEQPAQPQPAQPAQSNPTTSGQ